MSDGTREMKVLLLLKKGGKAEPCKRNSYLCTGRRPAVTCHSYFKPDDEAPFCVRRTAVIRGCSLAGGRGGVLLVADVRALEEGPEALRVVPPHVHVHVPAISDQGYAVGPPEVHLWGESQAGEPCTNSHSGQRQACR